MNTPNIPPLPLLRDQRVIDAGHLRTLSICHYVNAGLCLLGLGFIAAHYAMMQFVFNNPELWKEAQGGPPPEMFFDLLKWFYVIGVIVCVVTAVLNFMSARFIKARRNRMFSFVVAAVNCMNMPLGTLLGVFTFIVLSRDTVEDVYRR